MIHEIHEIHDIFPELVLVHRQDTRDGGRLVKPIRTFPTDIPILPEAVQILQEVQRLSTIRLAALDRVWDLLLLQDHVHKGLRHVQNFES